MLAVIDAALHLDYVFVADVYIHAETKQEGPAAAGVRGALAAGQPLEAVRCGVASVPARSSPIVSRPSAL